MKKGTITFSFDDGRKDTYHVMKDILKPLDLSGVVYIPSGYIECNYDNYLEVGYNGLMTKEELDELSNDGLFEIGGHGFMHKNDFEDLRKGINKLRNWYPNKERFGLASPHSIINMTEVEENANKYREMGFSYVRGGRNFEKKTLLKRLVSLLARVTKSPTIFKLCYMNSVNKRFSYYLHAIPIHKLTTLNQVKAIVDYCVEKRYWAILEFHGIDKENSEEYTEEFCWLEDDFVELCSYVKQLVEMKRLQVKTPISMIEENENE